VILRDMPRRFRAVIVLLASKPCFGAGFHALSLPGSQLVALSADGTAAAGGLVGGASGGFRWREGRPTEMLGGAVSVRAISASGRYVAGSSLDARQREVATWWDTDGLAHTLGGLAGVEAHAGVLSVASGITDAPSVAGTATDGANRTTAFVWNGAAIEPLTSAGASSGANGISSDGERIFGWSEQDAVRHGALWNPGRGDLAIESDAPANEIVGANRAATLLLGFSREGAAFRWQPDVERSLTMIANALDESPARFIASSDDGRLLAGSSGSGAQRIAIVWTEARGVERLDAFLAAAEIAVPPTWTLLAATSISADAHRLGGFGLDAGHFDSFVIDLPQTFDTATQIHTAP
jgi:hypothetical protein